MVGSLLSSKFKYQDLGIVAELFPERVHGIADDDVPVIQLSVVNLWYSKDFSLGEVRRRKM